MSFRTTFDEVNLPEFTGLSIYFCVSEIGLILGEFRLWFGREIVVCDFGLVAFARFWRGGGGAKGVWPFNGGVVWGAGGSDSDWKAGLGE